MLIYNRHKSSKEVQAFKKQLYWFQQNIIWTIKLIKEEEYDVYVTTVNYFSWNQSKEL